MPESVQLQRLLVALSLAIPLLSAAQAPALTDAERARRDAEKVLSFIKFQTVKTKPAAEAVAKPHKPAPPAPQRPTATARAAEAGVAEPVVAAPAQAAAALQAMPTVDPAATPPSEPPPTTTFAAPAAQAMPAPVAAEADPDPDADDRDEVPLQIQHFVAPVLPRSVQATLVGGSRKVTVRFTVEANGTVSKADAAADVPRRLARPATDAILQWQFAPLPQPRTVDVEFAFQRE